MPERGGGCDFDVLPRGLADAVEQKSRCSHHHLGQRYIDQVDDKLARALAVSRSVLGRAIIAISKRENHETATHQNL